MPNPTIAFPNPPVEPGWKVSDSLYIACDLYLIALDEGADVTLKCQVTDVVTISGPGIAETPLSTTAVTNVPPPVSGGVGVSTTVTPAAPDSTIVITFGPGVGLDAYWLLKVRETTPLPHDCTVREGANATVVRVLAAPAVTIVSPPAASTFKEKASITLSATVQYSQLSVAAPPAPLPSLPVLTAKWDQNGGNTAVPPGATMVVGGPLSYNASVTFTAPAVYALVAGLSYQVTAWYDLDADGVLDAGEPTNQAALTLNVAPRNAHMVVLIDRSGSMSAPIGPGVSRWEGARRAAHAWADLYLVFRTGVAADKAGAMIFEAAQCGWGPPASPIDIVNPANHAVLPTLGNLAGLDQFTFDLGAPGDCTPIGDGLIKAMQQLQAAAPPSDQERYVIVLLTDGYENSGAVVVDDDSPFPAGATAKLADRRLQLDVVGVNSRLTLYSVGVGGTVQESVLDDLPNPPTMGPAPATGFYRLVTKAEDLMPSFAEMLGHSLEAERAVPSPTPLTGVAEANRLYFPVPAKENRLAVVLQWNASNDDLRLFHRPQAGGAWTQVCGGGLGPPAGVSLKPREKHGIAAVDLPTLFAGPAPATEWKIEYRPGGAALAAIDPAKLLVMRDLVVKVQLDFDKRRYATQEPMRLTARIRAGYQPVTGATVTVELARPGEGLGTFLAQNGINYQPSPPQGRDPNAPKAAMLTDLLKRRDMSGLPVVTPTAIFSDGTNQLFDDGAHQDGAPNDGDYANVFTGTTKEGTYTWRVFARGTLPDGSVFNSVLTVSKWVGVNVDPISSPLTTQLGLATTIPGTLAAVVTVRPMSAKGEFLGPFRGSLIDFKTTSGTWIEPLQGHYDGTYSRTLHYRRGDVPQVTVFVQGKPFTPVVLAEGCVGQVFFLIRRLFESITRWLRS